MQITLNIKDTSKKEIFLSFLSALDFVEIGEEKKEKIKKAGKFDKFAGLWQEREIDTKTLRDQAWKHY
jgi:hypothetical protein